MTDCRRPYNLMHPHPFHSDRHLPHVQRIWREIGWLQDDTPPEALRLFCDHCQGWIAELHGQPECYVATARGRLQHRDKPLSLCSIPAVTTGLVARKQGLASRLTAHALAQSYHRKPFALAGLGIFEQGFYDRLGFGTGTSERLYHITPAQLEVPPLQATPLRLDADDWQRVHQNRLSRRTRHGAASITPPHLTHAEILFHPGSFGLGFTDDAGRLTHHLWLHGDDNKQGPGPYFLTWMAYQSYDQCLQLFSLLRSLSDQIQRLRLLEPPALQLQDLLNQPIAHHLLTEQSTFPLGARSLSFWQLRICDLPRTLDGLRFPSHSPLSFNLDLQDPIAHHLPDDAPWTGVAGPYHLTLGATSSATDGHRPHHPTLQCGVGALTRLLFGVAPATTLAITDDLQGPTDLLQALDRHLQLPPPHTDWDL